MKTIPNLSNGIFLLILLVVIFSSCGKKGTTPLQKEPQPAEAVTSSSTNALSDLAKDMQFNTICDFSNIKFPSKDSTNQTKIVTSKSEISKKLKAYKKDKLENYSLAKSKNSYSLTEDLNKHYSNGTFTEDEFIKLFEEADYRIKYELLRRLTFEECEPLKQLTKFQEVLKAYSKSDEDKSNFNFPGGGKYPSWESVVIINQLDGYSTAFQEKKEFINSDKHGPSDLYRMVYHLSLEKDESLFLDGCDVILERIGESNFYHTLDHMKILDKLLVHEKHYTFSLAYIRKVLLKKSNDTDDYDRHVEQLSEFLRGRIKTKDWENIFGVKKYLDFSAYERISAALVLTESEFEHNAYNGALSINSMDKFHEISDALFEIVEIFQNNSLDENQKKIIKDDLISNRTNLIYGYIEPLVAICLFYCDPDMDKMEFDELFKSHQDSKPYLKLWKVKDFMNADVLEYAIKYDLLEETEMSEKLFEESYAFSAFPFDDHSFKSLMENKDHSLSYDADFGIKPVPYDNYLIEYLDLLGDQIPATKVLMNYEESNDNYVYELALIANDKMYVSRTERYGSVLSDLRKLINTFLEDIDSDKRLVSIVTEDTGVFDLFCVPDNLIRFYNHFQLDLCEY